MILRKIIKIVPTRCQILRLKCTKINFGWGYAPDTTGGTYSAPPDALAGIKGSYFKGRGGVQGKGKREGEKGGKRGQERKEGENRRKGEEKERKGREGGKRGGGEKKNRGGRRDSPYQS